MVALGLLSAGCTKTLKKESVEGIIKTNYEKAGLKFKSVTCPSREAKAGDKFECTSELEGGGKPTFTITQKDAKGNLEMDVVGVFVSEAAVAEALTKEAGAKIEAKCAVKATVLRKGDNYTCEVVGPAGAGKIVYETPDDKKATAMLTMAGQAPKAETVVVEKPATSDQPTS